MINWCIDIVCNNGFNICYHFNSFATILYGSNMNQLICFKLFHSFPNLFRGFPS
jgi:hypothetical protein